MANNPKVWTAEDIEKIWNDSSNGVQKKTAPLPTLNDTSKKVNYTPKSYEKNKVWTGEEIEQMWKTMDAGKAVANEQAKKSTNTAPKYGNKVPSKEEVRRKQIMEGRDPASKSVRESKSKDLESIDRRNLTREEEAKLKRQNRQERAEEKKRNAELNNVSRNVGDNGFSRYNSRFSLEKPSNKTVAEKIADTQRDRFIQANKDYNRAIEKQNNTNDILDDNTLSQLDARARQLQAMDARTPEENAELQDIYDRKEKHDQAIERNKRTNGENHVVNNERYNQLMSDNRLASDMDKLVDIVYNNANQDATVSEDWANDIGAKNITGGLTKDQFINEMSRRYDLTKEELLDMALTRKTEQYNAEIAQYNSDLNKFGNQNPLVGSLGSFIGTAGGVGEGAYNILANAITGDDRYTSRMFNTTKEGLREGAKQNIDTDIMKGVYDIGMGVGDMGVGALMGSAPTVLAGNTANRTLINSVDKGIDPRQAALYAGLTGVTDYVTNKIGLDKAKDLAVKSILDTGWKGALAKNAVAGLGEAGENVIQDVAQNMLDRIINGEDSELSTAYNNLIAQGYSEEDAFKEVAKQFGQQELMSAAQGYAMGSVMQGGKTLINNAIDVSNYLANKNSNGVVERANEFNEKNKAVNEGLNNYDASAEANKIEESTPNTTNVWAEPNNRWTSNGNTYLGKVTKVMAEYTGDTSELPVQSKQNANRYDIPEQVYNNSVKNFNNAKAQGEKGVATRLKKVYEGLFGEGTSYDTKVDNLSANGKPYYVTVNKGSVSKALGKKVDANKLSVIEDLDNIISESNYVGSADYAKDKNTYVKRYDYFEKPVSINGKNYIVSFSVAVEPHNNNYRTHAVIDEMKIQQLSSDTGATHNSALLPDASSAESSLEDSSSKSNVNPNGEVVNTSGNNTGNQLPMDLQFFANKKAEIEDALQNENLSVEERADLEGQLDEVNRKISQFATNSAINSGVVSQDTLDNDPFYKEAKMVTPTTETATLDEAKGRIAEGNDTWVDAYNDGSKKIETATDVDTTMLGMRDLDNRIAEATDDATREQLQAKKNMLFAKAVQAVHNGGQFLQALKKWNRLSTDGVLLNAEKLAQDIVDDTYGKATGEKTSKNVKTRESSEINEKSQKIINAIKKADGEDISKPVKKDRTLDEVRQIVRNTFDGKLADRVKDFTDDDYNYVANLLKNGASTEDLSNAFKRRFATGKWGISDEARTQVNDLMNYAQSLDLNSRERVATEQKIFQILADEIYGKDSANFKEKFEAWRYLAMLGNPKTHVRNIIGNTLFQGVTGMSNTLAAKMEDIADKRSIRKTGHGIERTKAVLHLATDANDRALVKGSASDSDKTYGLWSGNKWNEDLRNNIESQKRIFKNGGVNAVNELNSNLLDAEDNMAMRSKYATSLAGYLKANGEDTSIFKIEDRIKTLEDSKGRDPLRAKEYDAELEDLYRRKEILDKGREHAIQSAKYSAFHEDNALADSLSKWSKDLKQKAEEGSKGAALMHYLIEGMLPFKKTPANILRSGVEYSPLNLVNDISKLRKYKKGYDNVELADVFDSMSKTLTGSAIMALGALMYDKGVLLSSTGDEKYQDQLEGKQNYSLRIGDYTATIDFAAPSVMPLLLGAEVMKSLKDDGLDFNDFVDAIESNDFSGAMEAAWEAGKNTLNAGTRIASPLVETSMLQGVNDTLEGISDAVKNGNAGDALSAVTGNLLTSYVTSGIPTLVGQVARATDNTRRSTTGGVKTLEKLQNKIPYLSTKNQPYIDAHGREQTNSPMNNILGRLAYQMFSPSYVAKVNETEGDKLAREVYNETKNPDVFSAWTGSKKIDGQKVSPEDYTKYMQTRGDADTRIRDMLAGDEWFRGLSKSDQEDILTGLKGLTDKIGEQEINPNFTSTSGELAAYNENPENLDSLLNYYKDKIHKGEVKNEMGSTSDFATALYDSGNQKDIDDYKKAAQIAADEYGKDSLTEEQYLTYKVKGEKAFRKEMYYDQKAKEYEVSDSKAFRTAVDRHQEQKYVDTYNAITSVPTGKDELGRETHLAYNSTTQQVYDHGKEKSLKQLVTLEKKLPKGLSGSGDRDVIKTLNSSSMSNKDKAFFFGLHKGSKDLAKKAPKPTNGDYTYTYMWYLVKNYYDSDNSGQISKSEQQNIRSDMANYLSSLGYTESQIDKAKTWDWSSR